MAKGYFTAFIIGVALSGCVSSGTKVTSQQTSQFKVGVTTEQQVIGALGAPQQTDKKADGSRVDTYVHTAQHATAATWIPVVGLLAGGAKGTTDAVAFTFSPAGVLESESSSRGNTAVHTGLLNQD